MPGRARGRVVSRQEENYEGIAFPLQVSVLAFWPMPCFSPGTQQAGGSKAGLLLPTPRGAGPFAPAAHPSQRPRQRIDCRAAIWRILPALFPLARSQPKAGNNLQTQQLPGQGPATGKDEGSLNQGSVGWKEFLEVKDELRFAARGALH